MLKQIHITYGSKQILKDIKAQFPERKFLMFASNNTVDNNLQLVDVSDKPNVFKSGVTYDVKNCHGDINWQGFFNYNFITVYPEYLNLFERRINSWMSAKPAPGLDAIYLLQRAHSKDNLYVVLTIWQNPQSWQRWRKSDAYFFTPYINKPENKFHEANYESRNFDIRQTN